MYLHQSHICHGYNRFLLQYLLAAFLRRYGKPVTACADIPQAVAQLLENTPPDGAAVCCGSLYLLGDVAQALEKL